MLDVEPFGDIINAMGHRPVFKRGIARLPEEIG
jgi:hypothetical protein